jgi:transposase
MTIVKHRLYRRVSKVKRAQAVALKNNGLSIRKIGMKLRLKPSTTQAILNKWKSMHTIDDLPKKSRSQKLSDRMKHALTRMMTKGEVITATELTQIARTQYNIYITSRTIRNMLHGQGMKVKRAIRKPKLTAEHKKNDYSLFKNMLIGQWLIGNE